MEGYLFEMAQVGRINDRYAICIFDDEGPVPHLHILDIQTKGNEFNCCVRLDEPEYFRHGKKKDKLNSRLKKEFILFMMETNKEFEISNYDVIVKLWNTNNPSFRIDPNMPDYNKLR